MRLLAWLTVVAVFVGVQLAVPERREAPGREETRQTDRRGKEPVRRAPETARRAPEQIRREQAPIRWRRSVAVGHPSAGTLVRGVRLPAGGRDFYTWDPVFRRSPNRAWRRFGTDRLIRTLLRVIDAYAAAHPRASRVGVGDLSRPNGGDFGPQFGGLGHVSHENGLDADVYYPRRDRRERPPATPAQIDRRLAQELVDRFVAAGAERVFVGPRTGLRGPRHVVQILVHHDNHLHVRIPASPRERGR